MENERTKELAYLLDSEEKEVETLVDTTEEVTEEIVDEDDVLASEEKKVLTKEEKKLEKQIAKKRSKERFPKKTVMNLNYKVDKTTGPATILLYVALAAIVFLGVVKFGVLDMVQKVNNLEQQLADMETDVQTMMVAVKDYSKVQGQYNRYTRGYLQKDEKVIDRLVLLDMLEETVFAGSNMERTSIVDDGIFITYTGLDLEGTSALVKQLETYKWVKDVTVQNATRSYNEITGVETITTSMIIEIYASMEEVPANE